MNLVPCLCVLDFGKYIVGQVGQWILRTEQLSGIGRLWPGLRLGADAWPTSRVPMVFYEIQRYVGEVNLSHPDAAAISD